MVKMVIFFKQSNSSHRAFGHEGGAAFQFLLQHQRLPHPADGPGSGPPVPGQPRVPGGPGHAQRQQGAAHSAYMQSNLFTNPVCRVIPGIRSHNAMILCVCVCFFPS